MTEDKNMISANDLRNVALAKEAEGYSCEAVDSVISQAADTIEAYANENKELYRKMEILAGKIEEYRNEEDSIKTALITAQKMADKIEQEAKDKAESLISESEAKAKATTEEAELSAEKAVSEARDYAAGLIKTKTEEADGIIADAEKKANDAINSSKIVAQDILAQAKGISKDLISSSKEEKEAYELLNTALRKDAGEFIEKLKALYTEQLDALNGAKLEKDTEGAADVEQIENQITSLLDEIDDMEESIPEEIMIESDETPVEDKIEEIDDIDDIEEFEKIDDAEETEDGFEIIEEEPETADEPEQISLDTEEIVGKETEEDEVDAMAAVEAFSKDEITPVTDNRGYSEITEEPEMEEKSLFEGEEQPFESYFNVSKKDAHLDKTQTISLVPPEDFDEEDGDEPKHKGFFHKKK